MAINYQDPKYYQPGGDLSYYTGLKDLQGNARAPSWWDVYNQVENKAQTDTGMQVDRAWDADPDAANQKGVIDSIYQGATAAWNAQNPTQPKAEVAQGYLGTKAQPNPFSTPNTSGLNGMSFAQKAMLLGGLAAGGAGLFGGLGAGAGGLESLNGGSFLAANDAAMASAGTSALGTGGMFGGIADGALGGGLAGAGLGGASFGAMEAGLGDFGLSSFGNSAFSGLGIDSPTNPFSFDTGPMNNFDGPFGGPSMNGTQSLFNPSDNSFEFNSPTTNSNLTNADSWIQKAVADGAMPSSPGSGLPQMPSMGDLVKKYGFDGAKSLYNYLQNQRMSRQAQELGKQASNVMGQPERQPFLNEAQQIAQGNLGAGGEAIKAAVDAQAQARYARYGYGGTETSKADTQLAAELAKYGNDRLNALLGYTGANQNTTTTAYLASRDSMAFATQSFQGFSALAAKIGAGVSGGKSDAEAFGAAIMNFFS